MNIVLNEKSMFALLLAAILVMVMVISGIMLFVKPIDDKVAIPLKEEKVFWDYNNGVYDLTGAHDADCIIHVLDSGEVHVIYSSKGLKGKHQFTISKEEWVELGTDHEVFGFCKYIGGVYLDKFPEKYHNGLKDLLSRICSSYCPEPGQPPEPDI